MKWKKIGRIFDPTEQHLTDGYNAFAKSPQALVFKDFVRIYFCAQKKTENGKYISSPHYVDFDKDLQRLRGVSPLPAIQLGGLGSFDEHGIFPINVLRHSNRVMAFTTGWSRRNSVSIEMGIGFAESFDGGMSFIKQGLSGPIMTATHNEPCLVGDAFVRYYDGFYHMWYIFGGPWRRESEFNDPDRFYRIAYARSADGQSWERNGQFIIKGKSEMECQALPTVFKNDGLFHMYFCYRDTFNFRISNEKSYRLGYAYSYDGLNWTRNDEISGIEDSTGEWDSDMKCYPHVFECDGKHFLLYNGNEFGKYGFGAALLVDI